MGILTGGLFGSLSGKVGNVVYRKRGGKTIVAVLPSARKSSLTENEIMHQNMFALTGKIAKAINCIELLKYFWRPISAKNQASYHLIFKKNYGFLNVEDLEGCAFLTPSEGFRLINPSLNIGGSNLVIECRALGNSSSFDLKIEKYVAIAGIVILKNPKSENVPLYNVFGFKSKKYLLYPNDYLSIKLEFTGSQLEIFESYSIKKVFAVFVTLDEEEGPVQHSNTLSNGE